jgi:hypothetical protein
VKHPVTPDGRYIVVRGRLWRMANPDLNRHMAENTPYADWYATLARSRHGGL